MLPRVLIASGMLLFAMALPTPPTSTSQNVGAPGDCDTSKPCDATNPDDVALHFGCMDFCIKCCSPDSFDSGQRGVAQKARCDATHACDNCLDGDCGRTGDPCMVNSDCDSGKCGGPDRQANPICVDGWEAGHSCSSYTDCLPIGPGLHRVCRENVCQSGAPVCQGKCCDGDCGDSHHIPTGSRCGETDDCLAPPGLTHPVCRGTFYDRNTPVDYCQSGNHCSLCGVPDDCDTASGWECHDAGDGFKKCMKDGMCD